MRYVRRKYKNFATAHFKLLAIDRPANMAAHNDRNLLTRVLVNRNNTTLVELHFRHEHLVTLNSLAGQQGNRIIRSYVCPTICGGLHTSMLPSLSCGTCAQPYRLSRWTKKPTRLMKPRDP